MNLLVHAPLSEKFATAIRKLSPEVNLVLAPPEEPLPADALREADVLYGTHAPFALEAAPRLRWLQLNTAAANQLIGKPILGTALPVTTVRGAYTVAVAECAIAMMLALSRRIPKVCRLQSEHVWDDEGMLGEDLHGKTLGIIGYGSIGRQIAKVAGAVGMHILAAKRDPTLRDYTGYALPGTGDAAGELPAAWFSIEQLPEMLARCDVAVITLPLTPHTKNLIGARELNALPPHATLLNVGRGGVVNETVLLQMLQRGTLAAAAFDVFAEEPLPAESPLWDAPNLLVLPHIASWTTAQPERAAAVLVENLGRHLAGQPLLNVIDKTWMY